MESFTLLNYWRAKGDTKPTAATAATTTMASIHHPSSTETDDDDGSLFDLELTVPDDDADGAHCGTGEDLSEVEEADEDGKGEREFTIALSSPDHDGTCGGAGADDFVKARLVPIETSSTSSSSSSLVLTAAETTDSKAHQFPVSLLKSATRLRVLMLGFKKPRSMAAELNGAAAAAASSPKNHEQHSKFFINFKIEEVPIVSLFTRDSSSRSNSSSGRPTQPPPPPDDTSAATAAAVAEAEERIFAKDVVQRYINKIKPLYIRASKKYAEKLKFSAQLSFKGEPEKSDTVAGGDVEPALAASGGGGNVEKPEGHSLPAGLRVVYKRLGKSRSASSVVVEAAAPPPRRRDDSLIQQQDGIQSAIAHCKRSFQASSNSDG